MARPIKVITAGAEIRAELHRRANARPVRIAIASERRSSCCVWTD